MKLVFRGGIWDGVQMDARFVPQEIRLSGVIIDEVEQDEFEQPSLRKTVLMSRVGNHRYELDDFEGPDEDVAVYVHQGSSY